MPARARPLWGVQQRAKTEWRRKQDHFAKQAKASGMRSRAAFKLEQIHAKHNLLRPGMSVADLGAAPGGWTVVAAKLVQACPDVAWQHQGGRDDDGHGIAALRAKSNGPADPQQNQSSSASSGAVIAQAPREARAESPGSDSRRGGTTRVASKPTRRGRVVACDLLPMQRVAGATFVCGDFNGSCAQAKVLEIVRDWGSSGLDVVLSDMAPNTSGNAQRDHAIIVDLARAALSFAALTLKPGGSFCVKLFNGSELSCTRKYHEISLPSELATGPRLLSLLRLFLQLQHARCSVWIISWIIDRGQKSMLWWCLREDFKFYL